MSVTESGASGLTNAYKSVLSICGSAAVSGASRWLDAELGTTPAARIRIPTTGAMTMLRNFFIAPLLSDPAVRPEPVRRSAVRPREPTVPSPPPGSRARRRFGALTAPVRVALWSEKPHIPMGCHQSGERNTDGFVDQDGACT